MQKPLMKATLSVVLVFLLAGSAVAAESTYIVQEGDSLYSIAAKTGFSAEQLMNNNSLTSEAVEPGQELILILAAPAVAEAEPAAAELPVVAVPAQPAAPAPVAAADTAGPGFYTVQPGDSLQTIASQLAVTVTALKWVNDLNSEVLNPGTVLKVPGTEVSRSGENLTGERIAAAAEKFLGTPYAYGGSSPGGFDCSGFTSYLFRQFNISLPRTASGQFSLGVGVAKSDLRAGDLVFFNRGGGISHVGVYVGNGQFIHSSSPRSGGVISSDLSSAGYYTSYYYGAKRVLP